MFIQYQRGNIYGGIVILYWITLKMSCLRQKKGTENIGKWERKFCFNMILFWLNIRRIKWSVSSRRSDVQPIVKLCGLWNEHTLNKCIWYVESDLQEDNTSTVQRIYEKELLRTSDFVNRNWEFSIQRCSKEYYLPWKCMWYTDIKQLNRLEWNNHI